MDNRIESGNLYVAFQVENNTFAVPMNDVWGIVAGDQNTIHTIVPNAPKYVNFIVELDGYFITIVTIPGTQGDTPIIGNYIVILEHTGQKIGIISKNAYLVTISSKDILQDRITGQKSFVHTGKTYLMLDISQLNKELGI